MRTKKDCANCIKKYRCIKSPYFGKGVRSRMNKAFEKISKRLDELIEKSYYSATEGNRNAGIKNSAYHKVKKIVQEVAEEYNGGWISCSERLPEENQQVILQDFYGNITIEKMKITDGIEGFSDGDWWASANNYVAWQPLPELFKERD